MAILNSKSKYKQYLEMKNTKILFGLMVLMSVAFSSFGQKASSDYLDSLKQLKLEQRSAKAMEYQQRLEMVNQYNQSIDLDIQNKALIEHRLNLNSKSLPMPVIGIYNQNVNFYFDSKGGDQSLKKIIVMTIFSGDKRSYQEFLFSEEGTVYKVTTMPDMSDGKTAKAFYYEQEKMVMYTKDGGQVYGADDVDNFDEDAFKESVDWLNKAANFQALYRIMKSIEPSRSK